MTDILSICISLGVPVAIFVGRNWLVAWISKGVQHRFDVRLLPIAPIFIADRASLAVSREKDWKLRLVYADRMTSRSSCLERRSLAQTDNGPFMTSGPDPLWVIYKSPRNPWLCQARRVGEARTALGRYTFADGPRPAARRIH
jgi:hypothetical protein